MSHGEWLHFRRNIFPRELNRILEGQYSIHRALAFLFRLKAGIGIRRARGLLLRFERGGGNRRRGKQRGKVAAAQGRLVLHGVPR